MIKPEQYVNIGKIIQVIEQSGFRISNLRMLKLSPHETQEFFTNSGMKFIGQDVIQYVSSDMVVGMELVRENAIGVLQQVMGPNNIAQAKSQYPNTIRASFGRDSVRNAIHGSDTADQ
jgi:nucleoside-diphosphate kinase